jgi:uncharacterized protein (TIGR00251 family)
MNEKIVLSLHVIPNSKEFKIIEFNARDNVLRLKTKEKALKNKANQEIEKKLSRILKERVKIIEGLKSKNKKILIENKSLNEVLECLKVKQ